MSGTRLRRDPGDMLHLSRFTRVYPLLAAAGIALAAAAFVFGALTANSHLDTLNLTVSEYAVADRGGATGFAMTALGVAAFALTAGLRAVGAPVRGAPERLLLGWGSAMAVAGLVPALLGGAAPGLAVEAHRYASIAAFVGLPVAAGLLVGRFGADERWRPVARPFEWLALAGGFGLLAITYAALPGDGVMVGLAERALLAVETGMLAVLVVHVVRITWGPQIRKLLDRGPSTMANPVLFSRRS
ncbi:hypothetical protein GCM10023259_042180 [Thermocatellispora tengchongensis]